MADIFSPTHTPTDTASGTARRAQGRFQEQGGLWKGTEGISGTVRGQLVAGEVRFLGGDRSQLAP